jgi:hypothetical protein
MSYLCGQCPVIHGLRRGLWKTVWGPVSSKEGKTHNFYMYWEVFIVGRYFWNYHASIWNFRTENVFLDNNYVIKESNKYYHLNLISKHTIRNTPFMRRDTIQ